MDKNSAKWIEREIERVDEALKKTESEKLKIDYTKYKNKLKKRLKAVAKWK